MSSWRWLYGSALCNPGKAGYSGLFRNEVGDEWIMGIVSGSLGITCNLHAELKAVHMGLQIAWEQGIRKLVDCNSDSKEVC